MYGTSVCGDVSPSVCGSKMTTEENPFLAGGVRPAIDNAEPSLPVSARGGADVFSLYGASAGGVEQAITQATPAQKKPTRTARIISRCRRRAKPVLSRFPRYTSCRLEPVLPRRRGTL